MLLNDLQRGEGDLMALALLDELKAGGLLALLQVAVLVTVVLGCGAGLGMRNCAGHELAKAC